MVLSVEDMKLTENYLMDILCRGHFEDEEINLILNNQESVEHIREWVDIMKDEPEEWIKLSEVYHSLRRMLGDED